jgi:hypothetical protein
MVDVGEGNQPGEEWWVVALRTDAGDGTGGAETYLTNQPSAQQPSGPTWIQIGSAPGAADWSKVAWTGLQLGRGQEAQTLAISCLPAVKPAPTKAAGPTPANWPAVSGDPVANPAWASHQSGMSCTQPSGLTIDWIPRPAGSTQGPVGPYTQVAIGEGSYPGEQWYIVGDYETSHPTRPDYWLTNSPSQTKNPNGGMRWFQVDTGNYAAVQKWWDETTASWTSDQRIRGAAAFYFAQTCL